MIDLKHINFSYHSHLVLCNISCHIHAGSFVALVGPNGSGKSTLIKCICGILKTQSGSILIDGLSLTNYANNELAHAVAYIPQSEKEYQAVTVFDMVLAGRKPYFNWRPSENDLNEVAHALSQLGISDLAMRYVNELSGGQQQTVMIARALVQKTRALFLDEPTANLDIRHQVEVMELLKTLSSRGLTIVMSVHDINIAFQYASHILMLKEGHVLAYETGDNISCKQIEHLYDMRLDAVTHNNVLHVIPSFPSSKQ